MNSARSSPVLDLTINKLLLDATRRLPKGNTLIDSGNTAWVLVSAALVLLMTPGLAFFYGGMVRPKSIISILTQNFITIAIVSVLWAIIGFSIAFGPDGAAGLFGNMHYVGLGNLNDVLPGYTEDLAQSIPPSVFIMFQLMFAIITPALFTGAIADRMKFTPFVVLVIIWSLVVYAPIAHWVFSPEGWLFQRGALDFAGGTVVHINAGAAALALVLVLGKRVGFPGAAEGPRNNVPFVILGAGLLWFGWFGFNAGSAGSAGALAGTAFIATQIAAATATLTWVLVERLRGGKPTAIGMACGAVAGLVAITPAAGYVNPVGAIAIGAIAGIVCCLACTLKYRFGYDDALDVVGVHLFGGIVGAIAIGFFATSSINGAIPDGVFYGGSADLLVEQLLAVAVVGIYSFMVTFVIAKVLDLIFKLRVTPEQEEIGLDMVEHGELAYNGGVPITADISARDADKIG